MKFIVAIQNNTDVVFSKSDEEFAKLLAKTSGVNTTADGMLESARLTTTLNPFVVNLLKLSNAHDSNQFSELVGGMMSLSCKHTIAVSRTINGIIYLAINGDQTESKEFLVRKIYVLHRLFEFLCGPHPNFVKSSVGGTVRGELSDLLDLWVKLYNTDQTFLIEAVEKVHVRKQILEDCLKMLDQSLTRLREASMRSFSYGLFFVNGRLLSLANSSGARDILSSDMMLLMLWAHYAETTEQDLVTMKRVFLKTYDGQLVHRLLHVIRVYPHIIAVYLSETRSPGFEMDFYITLTSVKHFLDYDDDSVQTNFDKIEDFCQELSRHCQSNVLVERLSKVREARRNGNGVVLQGLMGGLHDLLTRIFTTLILNKEQAYNNECMAAINTALTDTSTALRNQLKDYREFLVTKVQRNITSINYWQSYPGLVHFLYVRRSITHDSSLTAPTLATDTCSPNEEWEQKLIKEKTWKMVEVMRKQLQQNSTTVMIKDGDFCYTYFIRFKDRDGHHLVQDKPLNVKPDWLPVGTIAGDFYLKVIQQCFPNTPVQWIQCLELMCIHLSVLPTAFIRSQCEQLIESFWQILDSKLPLD